MKMSKQPAVRRAGKPKISHAKGQLLTLKVFVKKAGKAVGNAPPAVPNESRARIPRHS
jgi:hypothetical protein